MADRMIKNVSKLNSPLAVTVRCDGSSDLVVHLSAGETFWCPDERETKAMNIYQRKGFLEVSVEPKPESANYYETYPTGYWDEQTGTKELYVETKEAFTTETSKQDTKKTTSASSKSDTEITRWTKEETAFMQDNYVSKGSQFCVEKLGRTLHSVKDKARRMKLRST